MGLNDGLSIVAQNYEFLKILGQNWVSTVVPFIVYDWWKKSWTTKIDKPNFDGKHDLCREVRFHVVEVNSKPVSKRFYDVLRPCWSSLHLFFFFLFFLNFFLIFFSFFFIWRNSSFQMLLTKIEIKPVSLKCNLSGRQCLPPCRHSISLLGSNVSWRWGILISFEMHDSFSGSAWFLAGHEYLFATCKLLRGIESSRYA